MNLDSDQTKASVPQGFGKPRDHFDLISFDIYFYDLRPWNSSIAQ